MDEHFLKTGGGGGGGGVKPAINGLQMSLEDSTHPHVLLRHGHARGPDDASVSDAVVCVGNGGIVVVPATNVRRE